MGRLRYLSIDLLSVAAPINPQVTQARRAMLGVGLRKLCTQDSFENAFLCVGNCAKMKPRGVENGPAGGSKIASWSLLERSCSTGGPHVAAEAKFGELWGCSGALLAALGAFLGPSWAALGASWAAPGAHVGLPGAPF